ncbi:streptophobe family protein [Streptomyces sp. NPDC003374]
MSAATQSGAVRRGARLPWLDVLLSAIACVSWALVGMAGVAALGLHLLGADAAGSLGPMTAAVVALGAGGSVTPSGDVSAFGLKGAEAHTAIQITPLGVSLAGALLLSWFFLRSLRTAGVVLPAAELLARAGTVVALFVAVLGGLAWAGHDVVTFDGGSLGLEPPGGTGTGGVSVPGLGDLGDIGGLLPDGLGGLIDAKAAVGFTVRTAPTLLGGLGWSAGVLLIALLASRRTPLPRGWEAVHRVVRPAASALVTVVLVAVAAGLAAAAYAAAGDAHPRRVAGAALLGAPNGVWLGVPIGLFVPWDGRATGELARLLPDPLDRLLTVRTDQPVTLGRLADLDGRVWLLGVAAALMMLLAGVLTAVRTPAGPLAGGHGPLGFAGRCAVRLGAVTASALPLLVWLTDVSVDASLSVLGFDAFGAGIELHGRLGTAFLLGAVWGAGAGAAGGLLAGATGAAGRRAAPLALRGAGAAVRHPGAGVGREADVTVRAAARDGAGALGGAGAPVAAGALDGAGVPGEAGAPDAAGRPGPYTPRRPYRPPNPATNPYLRLPGGPPEPQDARPAGAVGESGAVGGPGGSAEGVAPSGSAEGVAPSGSAEGGSGDRPSPTAAPPGSPPGDVYGAPTMIAPVSPRPRPPRGRPGAGSREWPPPPPDDTPPPPPPGPPRKPRK